MKKAILSKDVKVSFKPGSIEYTLTACAMRPLEWVPDFSPTKGGAWVIPPKSINEYHPGNFISHDLGHRYVLCPPDAVAEIETPERIIIERQLLIDATMWLGKMIADKGHERAVMPRHAENTLARIEAALEANGGRRK